MDIIVKLSWKEAKELYNYLKIYHPHDNKTILELKNDLRDVLVSMELIQARDRR